MKKLLTLWVLLINLTLLTSQANQFVMVMPSQMVEFDPQIAFNTTEAQIFTAFYEGLLTYDAETLRPVGGAAESWVISKDRKTYTFTLRNNLRFSDGSKITAQSFYHSFLRLLDPKNSKPYANNLDIIVGAKDYRTGKADEFSLGIKAIDDLTIEFKLTHPAPYFLSILTHYSTVPISQSQLPGLWDTPLKIAFSGPYIISNMNESELLLKKNPFYWDTNNVYFETIRLKFNNTTQRTTEAANRYQVDWVSSGAFDYSLVEKHSSVRLSAQFATNYYYFSSKEKAFKNPLVRKALVKALPLDLMRKNQPLKAYSLVPPINGYPASKGVVQLSQDVIANQKEAKKMLAKAGYKDLSKLPTIYIAVSYESDTVANLMKEAWEALGLEVDIVVAPSDSDYNQFIKENSPTLAMMSWVGDYLDPHTFLNMWTSKSPLNLSDFKDKAFDALIETSDLQLVSSDRLKTLADAEVLLLDSGYIIPIGHVPSVNLIDISVIDGWVDNPLDIHPFKYLKIKKPKALGRTIT